MNYLKDIILNPYSADILEKKELEILITFAADKFYNSGSPVMEDAVYDILVDFLESKYPKSKVLKDIGAKIKIKNKVKLRYWLGSMNKIKSSSNYLTKWLEKYQDNYILSDKLDGISALVIYHSNGNINMYTRGTASEGVDITPLIKYLNLPLFEVIKNSKYKAEKNDILMAFRGELILKKETFETNWSFKMKNARNTIAGLVNSKKINPQLAIDTKFVVYEIVDPNILPEEQLKVSKNLGFETVTYKILSCIDYKLLSEYLKKRRHDSLYMIDGVIVTNNNLYQRNTKSNPEYSFAYKDILEDQKAETIILDIEWNISKDGLIKPIIIIKPVNIGGVEIHRVTGHNARNVIDKQLGKNAIIELIRSGDVIPYIQQVIKPSKAIQMPDFEWSWNKSNVDIIVNDLGSKELLIKNIYYFFSTMETKGLGQKIVEKLVDYGLDSVKKIINATDFINVEGFKIKSSNNLVESIKKILVNVKLSKFMTSSNKLGHGIGEERIKQVLEIYPNILTEYTEWTNLEFINKLKVLNNWEEKTSLLFVSNFSKFIQFYNDIKDSITFENIKTKIIKNKYSDLIIVMSGFRDTNLQTFFENSGSKITNSISKNTNYLIVKDQKTIDNKTGKVKKALELGVQIITKENILE